MSEPKEPKSQSFDQIVKDRPVIWLLAAVVAAATAGFGAYPSLIAMAGRTTIENQRLNELNKAEQDSKDYKKQIDVLQGNLDKVTSGKNKFAGLSEAGFWAYREVNLRKEVGASFEIGNCPGDKCDEFKVIGLDLEDQNAPPTLHFALMGPGINEKCPCANVSIELVEGKRIGIATADLDVNILVELDRLSDMTVGVAVRDGSQDPDQKPKIVNGGLPPDYPSDKSKFYQRWGASPSNLPFVTRSDYLTRVSNSLTVARKTGKILMIQFGANWCPDCLVLNKMLNSDFLQGYLKDHFLLENIDVGRFDKNVDVATKFGVNLAGGIPAAVFVFPDGTHIATTGFGELENSRNYSPDQILTFLQDVINKKEVP